LIKPAVACGRAGSSGRRSPGGCGPLKCCRLGPFEGALVAPPPTRFAL
jgi:hypothetical protein